MNSKIVALVTLFAILFGCAYADVCEQNLIQLSVFGSSNQWWIAVAPLNGASETSTVEVMEASTGVWTAMMHDASWGYWQLAATTGNGFSMPLSFRLTDAAGEQVVLVSAITAIAGGSVINTNSQYGSSTMAPTQAATQAPTEAPTQAPTDTPTGDGRGHNVPTQAPTHAPTHRPTQASIRPTQAPTHAAATQAPTHAAATQAPTKKPTTGSSSSSGSSSGSSTSLCTVTPNSQEPLKLLVPLYVYPGSAWTTVIQGQQAGVETIAIINPNSGPDASGPDSSYTTYMAQMKAGGVTMVGYVHTSYGARSIADVTADINTYATKYPGLAGIFIDEASADKSEISYYTQVYNAITSHSGYSNVILNPGTTPDQGYLAVSTNIVVFENVASALSSNDFPSWMQCAPTAAEKAGYKYRFSGIAYAASQSNMQSILNTFSAGGLGMVFVTNGAAGGATYNTLPSFYPQQVTAVDALN